MTNLEKLYRARELIESRTGGRQQLALGWDGMPAVRIEDPCMVGVYFALIKNMLTGMYDSRVKGYIRTCGGYRPGEDERPDGRMCTDCFPRAGFGKNGNQCDKRGGRSILPKSCGNRKQGGE